MQAFLSDLFSASRLLVLDFAAIADDANPAENIQTFFEDCRKAGIDPKAPKQRQSFNNHMLSATKARYLVSRYSENRSAMLEGSSIAKEGRTFHLGIDIFCKDQEAVYAPCNGNIVVVDREPQQHSFGHYLILKPSDATIPYIFFGHLSAEPIKLGEVKAGQPIARIGDFVDGENGGWSRHLHLQMLTNLPSPGEAPLGYSSHKELAKNQAKYPDPLPYFPKWKIS